MSMTLPLLLVAVAAQIFVAATSELEINALDKTVSILLNTEENSSINENVTNITFKSNVSDVKPFLLPREVIPIHYRIDIIPLLFEVEDETSPYYNLTKFSAPGKVWIKVQCLGSTSNVTLHAHKDVKIDTTKITISNFETRSTIQISNVTRDNETDFLVLHLSEPIGGDAATFYYIYVEFLSRVADDRLNGLYLDYYIDPETKSKRYLSTTLFAPNHARKAFPCFDEPGFKANFTIRIGRKADSGYSSISNMPLAETFRIPELNGWLYDVFEESIPLPTYLVAMITTDFSYRTVKHDKVEIRLHAPEYLMNKTKNLHPGDGKYLGKVQNPVLLQDPLLFIEAALKIWEGSSLGRYPISKLDVVALPHFFFSAMENLGAITFKYPVILNVENVTTTSELIKLSFVIGHEIVHQWFGNMLTPKSWTYVWLKESFSDLFSRIFLSEKLNIPYNNEDFVVNELQRAMRFDGGPDTHPLENHIKTAASVGEIYTDIPYRKGASVMQMTRFFMGNDNFLSGLESLFNDRKFGNIDQNDLFSHLEKVQRKHRLLESQGLDDVTITDILNTWTQQSGYPILHVCKEESSKIFQFKQEQFKNGLLVGLKTMTKSETKNETDNMIMMPTLTDMQNSTSNVGLWWIPLPMFKYGAQSSNEREYFIKWLPPNNETKVIEVSEEFHSVTNVEGYFRIMYCKTELNSILQDFARRFYTQRNGPYHVNTNRGRLNPSERSQFLDDYFALAFAKYKEVPVSLLFKIMTLTLQQEREAVVWRTLFENISQPIKLLQSSPYYSSFRNYLLELLQPLYAYLQSQKSVVMRSPCYNPSVLTDRMNFNRFNSLVFSWLCKLDAEECREIAGKTVLKFLATELTSSIPADFQSTLYCASVKYASGENLNSLWSFFERKYFEEFYSVQRDRYLKALSCSREPENLRRLLSWTINKTLDFHDIDRSTLLKNVVANPEGRRIILQFLDENFDTLYKSESVANPVTESLKAFVEYTGSNEMLDMMETFVEKHSSVLEKKKSFLEKQMRKAKLNILWMDTFAKDIQQASIFHLRNTLAEVRDVTEICSLDDNDDNFEVHINTISKW